MYRPEDNNSRVPLFWCYWSIFDTFFCRVLSYFTLPFVLVRGLCNRARFLCSFQRPQRSRIPRGRDWGRIIPFIRLQERRRRRRFGIRQCFGCNKFPHLAKQNQSSIVCGAIPMLYWVRIVMNVYDSVGLLAWHSRRAIAKTSLWISPTALHNRQSHYKVFKRVYKLHTMCRQHIIHFQLPTRYCQ